MIQTIKKIFHKYYTFIKYIISSGISFVIDLSLFTIFVVLFKSLIGDLSIILARVLARIISSFFNYLMNRNAVFKKDNNKSSADSKTLIKYYVLVIIQMIVSSVLVLTIHRTTSINETIIKMPVDIVIFMVNYFVQKLYIFKK